MGKFAPFVDTVSIMVLAVILTFSFFPLAQPVSLQSMNWSVVIFTAVVCFSLTYYLLVARRVYKGPVERVRTMD